MIISAEMGESSADLSILTNATLKQVINMVVAITCLFILTYKGTFFINLRKHIYTITYYALLIVLFIPRLFSPVGGAYAWIRIAGFSIQPSEFAKVFIILYAAKMFAKNDGEKNVNKLKTYLIHLALYFIVIMVIQKDLGSAVVLLAIGFVCALIPPYKEIKRYQNWMILAIIGFIALVIFLLSPLGTKILEHFSDHYQILRFLSSANPFNYQYGSGYHLVMSLVSFATGGLFGLGYGKSIHKFMNFPNPSTDFILPVIVEELGLIRGFLPVVIGYGIILFKLGLHAKRCLYARGKIIISGTFMYFMLHFVLNIGGVSGLIPLTGVPLLLISSGGSSLIACMMAIGLSECEIITYRKKIIEDENSSGQV